MNLKSILQVRFIAEFDQNPDLLFLVLQKERWLKEVLFWFMAFALLLK